MQKKACDAMLLNESHPHSRHKPIPIVLFHFKIEVHANEEAYE